MISVFAMSDAAAFASVSCPFDRWFRKTAIPMAARIPTIRMTTSSSTSVNPRSDLISVH
jgi:hypothetical protein